MPTQSDKDSLDIPLTCKYFQEGWGIDQMDNIFHVIPINELNEHTPTIKCKCEPKMEIFKVQVQAHKDDANQEWEDHYFVIHKSYLLEKIQKSLNN